MSEQETARRKPVTAMLTFLAESPRTTDRPFADVLAEAVPVDAKPKAVARDAELIAAARAQWGARTSAEVSPAELSDWTRTLGAGTRTRPLFLIFAAVAHARVLDLGLGSRILGSDYYANPVWAASTAAGTGGLVGVIAMEAAGAALRAGGAKGSSGSVAQRLKAALGKNQHLWVTDTHLLFVSSTATRYTGEPVVRAAVPLSDIERLTKAPRLQMLLRFSIHFKDGSRAAFLSLSRSYAGLRAALARAGVGS